MKKKTQKILKTTLSLGAIAGIATSTVAPTLINNENIVETKSPSIQAVGPVIESTTSINWTSVSSALPKAEQIGTVVTFTYDPVGGPLVSTLASGDQTVEFYLNHGTGEAIKFEPNLLYDPATNARWVPPTVGTDPAGQTVSVGINLLTTPLLSLSNKQTIEILMLVRYQSEVVETNAGLVTRATPPTLATTTTVREVDGGAGINYSVSSYGVAHYEYGYTPYGGWVTGTEGYHIEQKEAGGSWVNSVTVEDNFPDPGYVFANEVVDYYGVVDSSTLKADTNYQFRLAVEFAPNPNGAPFKDVTDNFIPFTYLDGSTTNPPTSHYTFDGPYFKVDNSVNAPASVAVTTPSADAIPSFVNTTTTILTDVESITDVNPSRYYMEIDLSETINPQSWSFIDVSDGEAISLQKKDSNGIWTDQVLTSDLTQPTGTITDWKASAPFTTFVDMNDLFAESTYQFRTVFSIISDTWVPPEIKTVTGPEFFFTPTGLPVQTPGEEFIPPSEVISPTEASISFGPESISDNDDWVLNTNNSVTIKYSVAGGEYQTLELITPGQLPTTDIWGVYNQLPDGTSIASMPLQTVTVGGLTLNTDNYQFQILINSRNVVDFSGTPGVSPVTTFELETNVVGLSTGLSTGALIGIIVGSVAGVVLIGLGVWFYKKQQDDPSKTLKDKKPKKDLKGKTSPTDKKVASSDNVKTADSKAAPKPSATKKTTKSSTTEKPSAKKTNSNKEKK